MDNFINKKEPPGLILASASPRRAELLRQAGIEFTVRPATINEKRQEGEKPLELVMRLAYEKATALRTLPHALVLAADTIVFVGDKIFEKPKNKSCARQTLSFLSGKEHQVASAFCLISHEKEILAHQVIISRVKFRQLCRAEIESYAATGEGLDKAGSYAIQEGGSFLIEAVYGSYTNIIGLPLTEVLAALRPYL